MSKIEKQDYQIVCAKAKKLEGKFFEEINLKSCFSSKSHDKGKIGLVVEEYLGVEKNNKKEPDFANINLELKVCGLRSIENKLIPKERISLSMLNPQEILKYPQFINSPLYDKVKRILYVWYIYHKNISNIKFEKVNMVNLDKISKTIFKQIEKDYEFLYNQVKEGKCHEFSEKNTKYLGVARKGSGGWKEKKIKQPNSKELFYRRAFTFKKNIANIFFEENDSLNEDVVDKIKQMIKPYLNRTFKDLKLELNIDSTPKNIASLIFKKILGSQFKTWQEKNPGYFLKTFPLINGRVKEHFKINISLNNLIIKEKEWKKTRFYEIENNEFICLLVNHKSPIENSTFLGIKTFSLNDDEIEDLRKIYCRLIENTKKGELVQYNNKGQKTTNIKGKFWHVRPSAKNSSDTIQTRKNEEIYKLALWLNGNVILKKMK